MDSHLFDDIIIEGESRGHQGLLINLIGHK